MPSVGSIIDVSQQVLTPVRSRPDVVFFDSFRLDPAQQRLWRGSEEIPLRPKAFALLHELLQRPGQLVTKQELLDAVWPGTNVSDAVLKVCISEIRRALGDRNGGEPLIETRHRRGYRLVIVPAGRAIGATSPSEQGGAVGIPAFSETRSFPGSKIVGRDREIASLREHLALAIRGQRQMVFITGEAGIGKTCLSDALLDHVAERHGLLVGIGQCVEHGDQPEPFQPVLEALSHLCRQPGHDKFVSLLAAHAPTWTAQMPWVFSSSAPQRVARPETAAHARMIREMTEAVDRVAAEWGLVFVLEDLQWADGSTLDLLASLARPREAAALLLVGTSLPFVSLESGHRLKVLKQELQVHKRCVELPLALLTVDEIAAYLGGRFPGMESTTELAAVIHAHTEGNPLFMVSIADGLVAKGALSRRDKRWYLSIPPSQVDVAVPDHIHQAIDVQFDKMSADERRILEAASVVGIEFSAAAVAAALDQDALPIEEWCETLVRRGQYLQSAGIGRKADGRVTARFRFTHAFYQRVLYQRILPRMRMRWHLRVGEHEKSLVQPPDARPVRPKAKRSGAKRIRKFRL